MTKELLYSVEREYPVSIDVLWDAWVDASKLEKWYFPVGMSAPEGITVSDARVGGKWAVAVTVPASFSPTREPFTSYFFGSYTGVELNQKLEHTLHYTTVRSEFDAKDETTEFHEIIVDFEDRGESSWCKFSQFGELPEGQAEMAQAGMNSYFESLAQFLAR